MTASNEPLSPDRWGDASVITPKHGDAQGGGVAASGGNDEEEEEEEPFGRRSPASGRPGGAGRGAAEAEEHGGALEVGDGAALLL